MPASVMPSTLHQGRRIYTIGLATLVAFAVVLMVSGRWSWLQVLGVQPMEQPWADAHTLTGASVALEQGLDPMVTNPGDPWQRPMNYPRIWLLLAWLGCRPEHTWLVAWCFLLALALGLSAMRPMVHSRGSAWLLLLGAFAPTTWLVIERANSDALMFAFAVGAAWFAGARPQLTSWLVAIAAALKLYPIAALFGLLRDDANKSLRVVLPVAALFVAYVLFSREDLVQIRMGTMHADWLAYGIDIVPGMVAKNTSLSLGLVLTLAAATLAMVVALGYRWRLSMRLGAAGTPHTLAAFRIGSAIYLFTFLIGGSFDYRLIFLLLALPQLVAWATAAAPRLRLLARLEVVVVLLLLWSQAWRGALTEIGGGTGAGLVLDEGLTWSCWCGLAVLAVLTLPDWLVPAARRGLHPADRAPTQ